MAIKTIYEDPSISDTIQIDIQTTDSDGNAINPYRVDQVTIYFIARDFTSGTYKTYIEEVGDTQNIIYYTDAIPVKTYGDGSDNPAWLSTDTSNAYISQELYDDDDNAQTGIFRVTWDPKLSIGLAKEGDYMICWRWTPLIASPKQSAYISFYIKGDQASTTVIPSHITPSGKYEELLNLYTPQMYKGYIAEKDLTADVLGRMNSAVGKAYDQLENLVNQILDLIDANATHDMLLPYLSNLFSHKLWSNDITLWRRQIKRAMALNKKKGTYSGLEEALVSAGIVLKKLTKYWQIVSQSTWTESFVVESNQTTFTLSKTAILPVDGYNFEVYLRGVGEDEYVELGLSYVTFSNSDGVTTMTWIGDSLSSGAIPLTEGDIIRITYLIAPIVNQTIENYIRNLPFADQRDETTFIYPLKNWNVRLIAEDDVLFDVIIPQKHSFSSPVIWGQVRTEFAYSENIYNMEEFNGSLRDSNLPCDIDRNFLDVCSACQSSSISLDLELEDISDLRLKEARQIIKGYIPFHSQIHSITYSSAINEYMPPAVEDLEILIQTSINDFVIIGQGDIDRIIPQLNTTTGQFLRDQLSTAITMASGTATGFNDEIVLYTPGIRLDHINIQNDALLEILSGTNSGDYGVDISNIGQSVIKIVESPSTIPYPLDTSVFTLRLSNLIWTDAAASIYQDDLFIFSDEDEDVNFTLNTILTEVNSDVPWKITITSGIYAGTYVIHDVLPNNTLVLTGWSGTVNVSDLSYKLIKYDGTVVSSSSSGVVSVTRRGRVETEELDSWGVIEGDYILYDSIQYKIIGFNDSEKSKPYILDYEDGSAAGINIKVYRRLLDNARGYVDMRGMYVITTPDYESVLSIQDGSNPPSTPIEINSKMGNYLIKIDGNYYSILGWDAQKITVSGPKVNWGLSGTLVSFSLINYYVNSPIFNRNGVEFSEGIDRRGNEPVEITTEVEGVPLDICVSVLNNSDGVVETIGAKESIGIKIENRKGKSIEGIIKC